MKTQPFFDIVLPYPPSLNTAWRCVAGRVVLSARQRAFRKVVSERVMLLLADKGTVYRRLGSLPFTADITVYPPTRRAYDLDNAIKAILDALMAARVFDDDSQLVELTIRKGDLDKPSGACWVVLTGTNRAIPGDTPERDWLRRLP